MNNKENADFNPSNSVVILFLVFNVEQDFLNDYSKHLKIVV